MHGGISKIPTACPHCGHVQQEPSGVISTYCRSCGEYYNVADERKAALRKQNARRPAAPVKLRSVHCYECRTDHEVSVYAKSTLCPGCCAEIDLEDVVVDRHITRTINTRGALHVEKNGFLNGGRTTCRDAWIEGRLASGLFCEGLLRFAGRGIVRDQVSAERIVVERGADAEFGHALIANEILVDGRVHASLESAGGVIIGKHGVVIGDIEARWLRIERGAIFSGNVRVLPEPALPTHREGIEPSFYADLKPLPFFGEGNLAFG